MINQHLMPQSLCAWVVSMYRERKTDFLKADGSKVSKPVTPRVRPWIVVYLARTTRFGGAREEILGFIMGQCLTSVPA